MLLHIVAAISFRNCITQPCSTIKIKFKKKTNISYFLYSMLLIKIPMLFQVCRTTSMNIVSQMQKTCENKYLQGFIMLLCSPKQTWRAYRCCVVRPLLPGHNVVVCGWIKILFGQTDCHTKTSCHVTGRPWSKFFSGPLLWSLWWTLDTCVLFIRVSVLTFVYIFHPLIVIFRGASISSTDILILVNEMTDSLGLQIPDELDSFQDAVDYFTNLACAMNILFGC